MIRKADIIDARVIHEIALAEIFLEIENFHWTEIDTIVSEINKGNYFVYLENDEIVGILCLKNMFNTLHISVIATKTANQNGGIGSKLIDFTKNITKERNICIVVNTFDEYNVVPFYMGHGFEIKGVSIYNSHKYTHLTYKP